jgi:hypothetical protein
MNKTSYQQATQPKNVAGEGKKTAFLIAELNKT